MTIRGNYYAEHFAYIEIKLVLCPQYGGFDCASPEEIEAFFTNESFYVNVAFANTLINLNENDSDETTKIVPDDRLYFKVDPKQIQFANLYIREAKYYHMSNFLS